MPDAYGLSPRYHLSIAGVPLRLCADYEFDLCIKGLILLSKAFNPLDSLQDDEPVDYGFNFFHSSFTCVTNYTIHL